MADELSNQPLVLDSGSAVTKAGFAGAERPRVVYNSCVGRPKHARVMPGGGLEGSNIFVGDKVEEHRGLLHLTYPMDRGVVTDFADMERVWSHIYGREGLDISSEEHPVLLTESPLNTYRTRARAAEIFFETFNVPSMFVSITSTLSLYASGRTTGVVLDVGAGSAHAVPVYHGFALPHAIRRTDVAGRDVTAHLQLLLRRGGYRFTTTAEREVVRAIKEDACYVAFNPAKEEQQHAASSSSGSASVLHTYRLPDGSPVQIGPECFRAPEILFHPSIIGSEELGVHSALVNTIMSCDLDMRRALFGKVLLAGGSTLFPGFGDRLLNEVRKLAPKDTKIRISAPPGRQHTTWIGGSILASLTTFRNVWIRRDEFAEHGASIVHKRCL